MITQSMNISMNNCSIGGQRYIELDLLKAFSIIGVVLYHIGLLSSGFLGVDVFLVINGYLVTKGIIKKEAQGDFHYLRWLGSRVARLWPLIAIAVLFSLALGYFVMLPDDLENLGEGAVAANFFGTNILSAITTKNYWDIGNVFKPLMHLWYVGILMQCYIVYPIIFMVAYKVPSKKGHIGLWLLSSLCIVSLLLCLYPGFSSSDKFYYLPFRFYEMGIGGIVALLSGSHAYRDTSATSKNLTVLRWIFYLALVVMIVVPIDSASNVSKSLIVSILMGGGIWLLNSCGELAILRQYKAVTYFAAIGKASYSIYIWHQVVFAFYRYAVNPYLSIGDYIILLVVAGLVGWGSYRFVEKPLSGIKRERKILLPTVLVVTITTSFGIWLYTRAGVVREVPELDVSTQNIHRGMHAEYCDRVYKMNKPFTTDGKKRILVIGNSFARDFVNVLMESEYRDSVEISYIYAGKYLETMTPEQRERANEADLIFIRWPKTLSGIDKEKQYGISTKNFGLTNGYNYNRRLRSDYHEMRVQMEDGIAEIYEEELHFWGDERLVDFIAPVIDKAGCMPVFTDDEKYISQDCRHLTKAGAQYYAKILPLRRYLKFD